MPVAVRLREVTPVVSADGFVACWYVCRAVMVQVHAPEPVSVQAIVRLVSLQERKTVLLLSQVVFQVVHYWLPVMIVPVEGATLSAMAGEYVLVQFPPEAHSDPALPRQ